MYGWDTFRLTDATKKGRACQKGGKLKDVAKICCIEGSPIACPRLSRTVIEAYKVALASSEIQYDISESAETRLPNPAAKMKTPWYCEFQLISNAGVILPRGSNLLVGASPMAKEPMHMSRTLTLTIIKSMASGRTLHSFRR